MYMYMYVHVLYLSQPLIYNHVNVYVSYTYLIAYSYILCSHIDWWFTHVTVHNCV